MDTHLTYPNLVKHTLSEYAALHARGGGMPLRLLYDDEHQGYAVFKIGWRDDHYIYAAMIHIDIIDGKIWIQYDHTEAGIATELVEAGVPKDDIVLGFRPPNVRAYTGFGGGAPSEQHVAQSSVRAA